MSGGRAYYNELDPYAAQWLRNLIAAGHIAAGDVDERSIVDVRADDLRGYAQCHFFAGIGGWSLALRLAGWPDDRPVWTGSCPCQPFSAAGKQRGSDDERHLWPAFFRLIRERRPAAVFGEQVAGAAGLAWLDHVCADLEGAGYAAAAADLCAAGLGAPHIRQRLYWVAHAERGATERWGHDLAAAPRGDEGQAWKRQRVRADAGDGSESFGMVHADGRHASAEGLQRSGQHGQQPAHGGAGAVALGDAAGPRPQGREQPGQRVDAQREAAERAGAAGGGLANATGACDRREEDAADNGRPQGDGPADWPGRCGSAFDPWADLDWIECSDGKARPTQPGLFPLAHGIPNRVGRLRAYGNAIVPQVAAVFVMANMESDPC